MAQGRRYFKNLCGDNPILWALSNSILGSHIGIGLIIIHIRQKLMGTTSNQPHKFRRPSANKNGPKLVGMSDIRCCWY